MTTLRETLAEHVACGERHCETLSGASRLATCDYCRERVDAAEQDMLAWVGAQLAGAREVVAETAWRAAADFGEARDEGPRGYVFDYQAEWVIAALRDALGVPVAPNSAPVDPNPTSTVAAEFDRSNDTDGIPCEACPFAGCDGCEAEAARRANGEAK